MIRITVELIHGGIGKPKLLHRGIIYNDGTGDSYTGNYIAGFGRRGFASVDPRLSNWERSSVRRAHIRGFPRKRLSAWHLLARALRAAGY